MGAYHEKRFLEEQKDVSGHRRSILQSFTHPFSPTHQHNAPSPPPPPPPKPPAPPRMVSSLTSRAEKPREVHFPRRAERGAFAAWHELHDVLPRGAKRGGSPRQGGRAPAKGLAGGYQEDVHCLHHCLPTHKGKCAYNHHITTKGTPAICSW